MFVTVTIFETQFSYIAQLKISNIALEDAGDYTCYGYRKDNSEDSQTVSVTVEGIFDNYYI